MKKIVLITLTIVLIFCLTAIYVFIPGKLTTTGIASIACIPQNVHDCLENSATLSRWWPGETVKEKDSIFIYNDCSYKLLQPFTDGASIEIVKGGKKIASRILIIPIGKDSSAVEWRATLSAGFNPFKRVSQYFDAVTVQKNMQRLLDRLSKFASNNGNIYGFPVIRTTFTDTILFATRFFSKAYPSVEEIYDHIHELKQRIKNAGAAEKDFPMLNVRKKDSTGYETMIAICINKQIHGDKNYFISMMVPMKDRFLMTNVTGGPLTIQNAHQAIKNYMEDRFLSAPAIPFEILITDRSKEPDTSKWQTRIFHPSM
jgi:hypothetical protein